MHGYDANTVRSRYDYYYSISSPSLSQATNYFDNQASLFGEPVATLLPPPMQKCNSPLSIPTPLTPFNSHISSSSSARTNYAANGVHPSLIETFDNHLYESIRKNILDRKNNNQEVTDDLTKHHIWTHFSSSSTDSQVVDEDSHFGAAVVADTSHKRSSSSFGFYKNNESERRNLGPRQRTLSAISHNDMRKFHQISIETTSDTDNNNTTKITSATKRPPKILYSRNKSNLDRTSTSSSSKLNHSVSHVAPLNTKKPPLNGNKKLPLKRPNAVVPYTMVKSKSDLLSIKSYPESFTIVTSPRRSPSAGFKESKRRKYAGGNDDGDDDSIMDFEWAKPSAAMLLEAAQSGIADEEVHEEPPYITDSFGQHVSIPTTPILTDKVMVGSSHRVHAGTVTSHKKQAFAVINDYKNRKTRLLQHRHSEENMIDGRFSPYTRYCLQRELSAPTLNRLESFESDDGEFYYYFEEDLNITETGRQTSIGFVHKKNRSSSMTNLASSSGGTKKRPKSEMQKHGPQYASTPNFININKRAVIQSLPMEKINPRLVLHRSLKGIIKVYNTNVQKRTFSLEGADIILASGKIDPKYLAAMPIPNEEKRSDKLGKQQVKHGKKRALLIRRRKLSPIAGTPSKESEVKKPKKKTEKRDLWTPKRILNTPMKRLEERLKKDKFGRLITPKKAALPDFKNFGKKLKKKKDSDDDDDVEDRRNEISIRNEPTDELDEHDKKAINFMQQLQARNSLGKALLRRKEAKQPPPLTRQPSRQSIESIFEKEKPPLKKRNSKTSLKSVSASIKTINSMRSGKNEVEDEEAEAGDEITKLHDVKGNKKDAKSKIKGSMKILSLGRVTSATSTKSQKDSAPPPSRTGSKTSILSMSQEPDKAQDTPSRKSEILRAPSASSVMSMTTAAITSNPLNTTLTITNQLASQGAEFLEKKQLAGVASGDKLDEMVGASADADRQSMSSQKTVSSQKTNTSKAGSRKTSAKESGRDSAGPQRSRQGSFIGAIVSARQAVKKLTRKTSNESIRSEKSDATQITIGPGHGADNKDSSLIAGKVLEHSQRSLEKVQKTVDKATHEIHQTINEKLSDLKTLERKLSKGNLLEHDANNNDVEKSTLKSISRHSTKHDLAGTTSTTVTDTGTKSNTNTTTQQQAASSSNATAVTGKSETKPSTSMMDKDRLSVNAISVAPDKGDDSRSMARSGGLENQQSEDSNQMNSSTSSSMTEMRRKRCWGLSSCCDRQRSESAQMMINEKANQPQTKCQKCKNYMCAPFSWIQCRPCKRRKMDEVDMKKKKMKSELSWWERICCCSGCCKRCTKKGREERMKKKKMMPMKSTMKEEGEEKPSCWSRLNCFKCCKPCCSRISNCCCSRCCRKKQDDSTMSMESPKPNDSPSTCTRIFCFCCLCCRKPATEGSEKRASMTSQASQQSQQQEKKGNCCSRFCTTLFCCCCKKQSTQDSRRTSMLSKKQSLAPTIPPPEEKKPKLEMVLVEHASLMKGAIPVLPLCLAYLFLIFNVIIPGSGTILSGLICLCIGIPRFSQHDGARGRIGSFIINCIVGVSQAFTVIFCFVGWGWSIWWGTIMVHLAKRHRKLKKAEMLRQLDAERQATESSNVKEEPRPGISRGKSRDVERGIN